MIGPRQAFRLVHIGWILWKNGLDELVLAIPVFRPFWFLRYLMWWRWLRRDRPRGERIRRSLEELGPIFVKFGQILSTRRDLLPADIIDELSILQDRVPPFPGSTARKIIEDAYGKPVEQVLADFDERPIASASIAQVHAARLKEGSEVVVKVVRPDIAPVIRRDISLLYIFAEMLQRYWSEGRRLRPVEVVAEFEKNIMDELDLLREAANASQLRRNFAGSPLLYIPEVYWPLNRRNVMVMERISGIPISNVQAICAAGIDLKQIAERGVEIFFTQVFRHNFFHADMHPGNIFVAMNGQYIAVDFGIMGSLSEADKYYLAENFLAFFKRDYHRVAELHVESGWVPENTRVDEFESAIRTVCEPIFERPLAEISFGQLLLRLFQTARRFHMEVQPQLVLLQKTLLNIEGLGRQLYPNLDLWKTAKPFLERWMDEQVGTRAVVGRLKAALPQYAEKLPELPLLVYEVLAKARDGHLAINDSGSELRRVRDEMRRSNQRTFNAIIGGSLVLSAALIFSLHGANAPLIGWVLGTMGVLVWFFTWPAFKE